MRSSRRHRVQADIPRDPPNRLGVILHQHTLEPFGPQRPKPVVSLIISWLNRCLSSFMNGDTSPIRRSKCSRSLRGTRPQRSAQSHHLRCLRPVKRLRPLDQFGIGDLDRRRHPNQDMGVTRHQAIRDDLQAAELCLLPPVKPEPLLAEIIEQVFSAHNPENTVIDSATMLDLDSCLAHGGGSPLAHLRTSPKKSAELISG